MENNNIIQRNMSNENQVSVITNGLPRVCGCMACSIYLIPRLGSFPALLYVKFVVFIRRNNLRGTERERRIITEFNMEMDRVTLLDEQIKDFLRTISGYCSLDDDTSNRIIEREFGVRIDELGDHIVSIDVHERLAPASAVPLDEVSHNYIYDSNDRVDNAQGECSICLEEFEQNDQLKKLSCNHCFHIACIDQWLGTKKNCPLCRKTVG